MSSEIKMENLVKELVDQVLPQEIPYIYKNLITLINSDDKDNNDNTLKTQINKIIEEYNEEHFVTVKWENKDTKTIESSIISKYNKLGSRYIDYVQKKTFQVDHINLTGLDVEDYEGSSEDEEQETILNLASQLKDHSEYFVSENAGEVQTAVFPGKSETEAEGTNTEYILITTVSKNNEPNFWNGVWKSIYFVTRKTERDYLLKGNVECDVHYFEEGNVKYKHSESLELNDIEIESESDSEAELNFENDVLRKINDFEQNLDDKVIKLFLNMNESGFKNLRRILPITRSKINWGKSIGNYKLGQDASASTL